MKLVGKDKLQDILTSTDPADEWDQVWVKSWVAEMLNANWKRPNDILNQFPNVRITPDDYYVFPINDREREVYTQIAFQQGITIITAIR